MKPRTQDQWRKMIKRQCRANDLDALRLAFAIRIMDHWNKGLTEWQRSQRNSGTR